MSVTAKLTWTPSAPEDTSQPPPTVDVLEISGAGSGVGLNNPASVDTTADAGLGDAPTYPDPSYYGAQSNGSHLIHLTVSAGQTSVTLPTRSLSAALSWSPATANTGSPGMSMGYTAQIDSRELTISADVDATNMKSPAYNPDGSVEFDAYKNIVFTPVPHTPDADGTMRGDIGIGYAYDASYLTSGPGTQDGYPVNYTPHLLGTWGADSTYNWYSSLKSSGGSGPTFGNTYIQAITGPPDSNGLAFSNPGETGNVDHIHLTVTDSNDGAQGTGNYYMALHQPDEFLSSNQAPETIFKKQDEVEASAPGWATQGVGVNCTWNAPGAYWDYLGGGADVMAEIPGADESLPWFGAFCAVAGIAVDHLKPLPCTGPVSFDPQEAGSDYPDEALHPFSTTDHRDFVMIPHFWDMYTRTHLLQDVWNTSGFVGETPINSDVFVRQAGSYGTYKYQVTAAAVK